MNSMSQFDSSEPGIGIVISDLPYILPLMIQLSNVLTFSIAEESTEAENPLVLNKEINSTLTHFAVDHTHTHYT